MLDQDFSIERPKRVYRHGYHIMSGAWKHGHKGKSDDIDDDSDNPLAEDLAIQSGERNAKDSQALADGEESHASQHTFFIVNSQRKLKLQARNAVSGPYP